MSDLISRSELIDALKVHFDSCFREDGELLYSDHICTSDDVVDLIKLVENQPTAEIVKQGGDADDACEWKKYPFDWFTGCDGYKIHNKQGDYCPRCGKKIKVIQNDN